MTRENLAKDASNSILQIYDSARQEESITSAWSLAVAHLRIEEDLCGDENTDDATAYSRNDAIARLFKRLVLGIIRYQAGQWMMFFKSNHLGLVSARNQPVRSILKGFVISATQNESTAASSKMQSRASATYMAESFPASASSSSAPSASSAAGDQISEREIELALADQLEWNASRQHDADFCNFGRGCDSESERSDASGIGADHDGEDDEFDFD